MEIKEYYSKHMDSFIPAINGGKMIAQSASDALSKFQSYRIHGENISSLEWRNLPSDYNTEKYKQFNEEIAQPEFATIYEQLRSGTYDIQQIIGQMNTVAQRQSDKVIADIVESKGWSMGSLYSDEAKVEEIRSGMEIVPAYILIELALEYNYYRIGTALYGESIWNDLRSLNEVDNESRSN